ncbi:MAG TPA: hypothetical protein VNA15_04195 [Candidatus Angelobacter sp.]|nr:hypothetical protein [Candidatus Angelobacter sp.]
MSRVWYFVGAVAGLLLGFYGTSVGVPVDWVFRLVVKGGIGVAFGFVGIGVVWVVNVLSAWFKSRGSACVEP